MDAAHVYATLVLNIRLFGQSAPSQYVGLEPGWHVALSPGAGFG